LNFFSFTNKLFDQFKNACTILLVSIEVDNWKSSQS